MFPSGQYTDISPRICVGFRQPFQAEFPLGCTCVMEFLIARTIQLAAVDEQLFCGVGDCLFWHGSSPNGAFGAEFALNCVKPAHWKRCLYAFQSRFQALSPASP